MVYVFCKYKLPKNAEALPKSCSGRTIFIIQETDRSGPYGKFNEQTIAEHLGYSKYDLWKIMDGRLFWDEDEKSNIAKELKTTIEELYVPRAEEQYHEVGCMECRGAFSSSENKTDIENVSVLFLSVALWIPLFLSIHMLPQKYRKRK